MGAVQIRAAFGRMSASLTATVFFEAGDVPLGGMVKEAEDICRAVRSRTCLLSDRLQRLSKPTAGLVRAAGCMCGGRWGDTGELISPTWSYCMFWCEAPAYVVRRGAVRSALQEVELGNAFNGHARSGTHSQLGQLLEFFNGAGCAISTGGATRGDTLRARCGGCLESVYVGLAARARIEGRA